MKIGDINDVELHLTGKEVAALITNLTMANLMGAGYPETAEGYSDFRTAVDKLGAATKLAGELESA